VKWLSRILKTIGEKLMAWGLRKQREVEGSNLDVEANPSTRVERHRKMETLIRSRQTKLWREHGGFTPQNHKMTVPLWAECRGCGRTMLVKRVRADHYRAAPLHCQRMVETVLRKHRELDCPAIHPEKEKVT